MSAVGLGHVLGKLARSWRDFCTDLSAGFDRGMSAVASARAEATETAARRRRMAEFEASDPAGRVAAMRTRHAPEAARLRARYGIPTKETST